MAGQTSDGCPNPPAATADGCVVTGHLSVLYASAGDGAGFNFVDYGHDGDPVNPCGDTSLDPSSSIGGPP